MRRGPISDLDLLKEKNRILMEKLFKADKQVTEFKELIETVSGKTSQSDSLKDKKILELAKKNRSLQIQVESLKTKAAKAAEIALKMKKENDHIIENGGGASPKKPLDPKHMTQGTISSMGDGATFQDLEKKMKEHEKKITKLRNENQQLKGDLDKAIKCLERETGEVVSLDELAKDNT